MIKGDILIIGGGPAGMVASATSRQYYPNKSVVVVKMSKSVALSQIILVAWTIYFGIFANTILNI